MKIDRLIGILSILLQKDKITAPELAKKFEVSRRTINRDIEDLCKAGIPICTMQGVGGGISIMENYKMDRSLLTSKDMQGILAGLRSLDSISGSQCYRQLMERLKPGSTDFVNSGDSILIDLSAWDKTSLSLKIELIKKAIEDSHYLTFDYYAPKGEGKRVIEPYYIVFKWSSWYVFGWCTMRKDFRLFKLNRMNQLKALEEAFAEREVPMPDLSNERIFPGGIAVKAVFEPEMKWRLIEEFGPDCFTKRSDGKLLFQADYTEKENLTSWLLTFGNKVVLLEPKSIRDELLEIAETMIAAYKEEEKE